MAVTSLLRALGSYEERNATTVLPATLAASNSNWCAFVPNNPSEALREMAAY